MSDMANDAVARGSDFLRDLGEAARNNPVPAALIGMGVLWLFTGGRGMQRAGDLFNAGLNRVGDAANTVRSSVEAGAGSVTDGLRATSNAVRENGSAAIYKVARAGSDYAGSASDFAKRIPDTGLAFLGDTRARLTELFEAQPLALGGIGLAIGAGIAAALPSTEFEAEYFGEASDAVRSGIASFASEQADRAQTFADDLIDATGTEVQKQGLTFDGAKSAASGVADKLGRVVDAAKSGL